jgi:N-acetylmuramoyl-L-alanine amidase CwlA
LTADAFAQYVETYDFGAMPPDYVVMHHTAVPSASWAPAHDAGWDARESGLSAEAIQAKRAMQLAGIRNYYRDSLSWSRGPHLFIDERWIWLFTPMYHQGIHAAEGNGYWRGSTLHYSIGIEVVGDYTTVRWPAPVARLVGHAVAVLQQRLRTFELVYQPWAGGISGHRDYNKPACPGDAISNEYMIQVCRDAAARLHSPTQPTTYVVRLGARATVRTRPNRSGQIVATLQPGAQVLIDSIVQGEQIVGESRWAHMARHGDQADLGFIHLSAIEEQR